MDVLVSVQYAKSNAVDELRYPILVLVLFIFQDANQCYSSVLRTHLGTRHNMLLKKISIYKVASFLKGLRHDFRSKFNFCLCIKWFTCGF